MARRDELVNKDFEYFTITHDDTVRGEVIDLMDDTVAIVKDRVVTFNQLGVFARDEFDYDSVDLPKQAILDLADYIRSQG